MIRVGLDAMGGDFAPQAAVEGAIAALNEIGNDCRIVLFGDKEKIEQILTEQNIDLAKFDIVASSEVIEMSDHPAKAFQTKVDSSIVKGFMALAKGEIDGFASAGSTGAMMVGSMFTIRPIEGVMRPTIATAIPTLKGGRVTILDIGLNVDCKPEVLEQYALIGSTYAHTVAGIENPRVALLNIGEETTKGNAQAKAAHKLMQKAGDEGRYNFVGNIEASHIFVGDIADVVVCDGFIGNTVLKLSEGLYAINKHCGIESDFWTNLNYENAGGTPVLGVNGVVTIGHGKSTPKAIKNMIHSTINTVRSGLVATLKEQFAAKE